MKNFWKRITHIGSFPGVLLLWVPMLFFTNGMSGENLITGPKHAFIFFLSFSALSYLLGLGAAMVTKYFFFKHRPEKMEYTGFRTKIHAGSFPSMHTITAVTTSGILFFSLLRFDMNVLRLPLYALLALAVALSRIELKKHYPIDVLFGAVYAMIATSSAFYLTLQVSSFL